MDKFCNENTSKNYINIVFMRTILGKPQESRARGCNFSSQGLKTSRKFYININNILYIKPYKPYKP